MTEVPLFTQTNSTQMPSDRLARDEATLAFFGHDLRAALSDVVGGLRLVPRDTPDALTRAQIERVRVSAEVLARLLDQGLAVLLGGAPAVQATNLNLHRFLTDLDLRWSGRALEEAISFALHKSEDLPIGMTLDRVALDRVLSNLLGNAFRHSRRGQVVCAAEMRPDGGLRISVRDDGPGFPAGILDSVRTYQHRRAETAEPGSGLGLHIAADLTQRLGGRLILQNLDPSGAEAVVDLPAALSVGGTAQPEPEDQPAFLAGKRILVADDNPTSQAIIARLATALGAEVTVVGDGLAAVRSLESMLFDLLIVDVEMPRLSGLDVIRCLRKMPGAAGRTPVVAVTAYSLPANRKAILATGANDAMMKPLLCPSAFANVVRGVLAPLAAAHPLSARTPPPLDPPALHPNGPAAPLDHAGLDHLLELAGPDTASDLLNRLISDLQVVQHGLVEAAARADWASLRDHSHVLISLAGVVGAQALHAAAVRLNQLGHRMDQAALDRLLPGTLRAIETLIAQLRQVRRAQESAAG